MLRRVGETVRISFYLQERSVVRHKRHYFTFCFVCSLQSKRNWFGTEPVISPGRVSCSQKSCGGFNARIRCWDVGHATWPQGRAGFNTEFVSHSGERERENPDTEFNSPVCNSLWSLQTFNPSSEPFCFLYCFVSWADNDRLQYRSQTSTGCVCHPSQWQLSSPPDQVGSVSVSLVQLRGKVGHQSPNLRNESQTNRQKTLLCGTFLRLFYDENKPWTFLLLRISWSLFVVKMLSG